MSKHPKQPPKPNDSASPSLPSVLPFVLTWPRTHHPFATPQLAPGQLEVLHPSGERSEVPESSVTVVDRGFLAGDVVRLTGGKSQAGVITNLETEVQLQRVLSDDVLDGWFDVKDLVAACRIARGDHVISGDWVGMVEEVFEMAMVETTHGPPRRICDTGNSLSVGSTTDVSPPAPVHVTSVSIRD